MSTVRLFIFVAAAAYVVVDIFNRGFQMTNLTVAAVVAFCFYINLYNSRVQKKKAAEAAQEEEKREERHRKKHGAAEGKKK